MFATIEILNGTTWTMFTQIAGHPTMVEQVIAERLAELRGQEIRVNRKYRRDY